MASFPASLSPHAYKSEEREIQTPFSPSAMDNPAPLQWLSFEEPWLSYPGLIPEGNLMLPPEDIEMLALQDLDLDSFDLDGSVEREERMEEREMQHARARASSLGFEDIAKFFCMPITEAAKAMKLGLTVLKKRCRDVGIKRWPHRKMKSLESLIRNVKELGRGSGMEETAKREIANLEEHKRMLQRMPEMDLSDRTKKLRQACFKANFKKRRAGRFSLSNSFSL